ncbi:hypothetical protein [Pseudomonas leptonychotis]|uniref:Restriction endonuclease n=1 Tax=Pseudomonas leptonychotis TaxID=2448482 RepID=A0A4T1ZXE1_9PSED|nr:hypothetical protein [Pseudomonas leptonychotis]TIH09145.1 hypothetical protein D8779_00015 [Pseudomonas leptonychotis]
MSPIDKIFNEIFGHSPNKAGTAYEIFSCIAEHLMTNGDVSHDNKIRGEFSKTLYQVDVHSLSDSGQSMGEAKDYTIQNKKVGRADLQKLGGALPDLPEISKGKFFSATGYTAPAKKHADAAETFPGLKPIEIYELRPSTEKDEEGTVKTIHINMHILMPHPQQGKWLPHLTNEAVAQSKTMIPEGEESLHYTLRLENFYDSAGNIITTLFDLTSMGYGEINTETNSAHGTFLLHGNYIDINGYFLELKGLEYEIPYTERHQTIEITDDSECRFVLKNSKDEIIRFITDEKLRTYTFDANGQLVAP